MTPVTVFAGRRVALFGLGGSGLATARALKAGGADVAAWDDNQGSRDKAAAEGIAVVDLNAADWTGFAAFVLSPGVPLTHPEPHWTVGKAKAAGVAVDYHVYGEEGHGFVIEANEADYYRRVETFLAKHLR